MKKVAPWKDYQGNDIYEGSVITHPSGQKGLVCFKPSGDTESDKWLVDYGDGPLSRLCLQIGEKGQAVCIGE